MIRSIAGFLLVILLASACAPTTDSPANNSGDPIPTREGAGGGDSEITGDSGSGFGSSGAGVDDGFVATLTGAVSNTVSGAGIINCENNVYVIRPALDAFPQVSLILPQGASAGNFNLVDNTGDGSVATANVFLADGRVFAVGVDGILVVNDLATGAGQAVSGSFDFSASSGSESITAIGEFDFVSGEDAFYCS